MHLEQGLRKSGVQMGREEEGKRGKWGNRWGEWVKERQGKGGRRNEEEKDVETAELKGSESGKQEKQRKTGRAGGRGKCGEPKERRRSQGEWKTAEGQLAAAGFSDLSLCQAFSRTEHLQNKAERPRFCQGLGEGY